MFVCSQIKAILDTLGIPRRFSASVCIQTRKRSQIPVQDWTKKGKQHWQKLFLVWRALLLSATDSSYVGCSVLILGCVLWHSHKILMRDAKNGGCISSKFSQVSSWQLPTIMAKRLAFDPCSSHFGVHFTNRHGSQGSLHNNPRNSQTPYQDGSKNAFMQLPWSNLTSVHISLASTHWPVQLGCP